MGHPSALHTIPELAAGTSPSGSIRIPDGRSVPMTQRLIRLVDHPAFQRLRRVRMLGPSYFVYPGAMHSRFEHALGVYDYTRQFLVHLLSDPTMADGLDEEDILTILCAGLLHDLGHYPFAHSLEALHLKGQDTPRHEEVGGRIILGHLEALRGQRSIATLLSDDWGVDPRRVIALCTGETSAFQSPNDPLLHSIISGTIDADKMDYLERDSHHMGVPYGRTFDRERLLSSLTLNGDATAIAIDAKGKVPAEMFVFARYTMFSEVYWHHTVRAASAMVENALAVFQSRANIDRDDLLASLLTHDDESFLRWLYQTSPSRSATRYLLRGLQPGARHLYKRIATYSPVYVETHKQEAYERIYALERASLFDLTSRLTARLGSETGQPLHPADLIIDIPPRDKDKLETIQVHYPEVSGQRFYPLHELSRVVAGIQDDFITVVKKIRIFAHPSRAPAIRRLPHLEDLLIEEILQTR